MIDMEKGTDMTRLKYKIPTRGLLGFRGEFMTETKGMGTISSVFLEYGPFAGTFRQRKNGVLIAMDNDTTSGYSLYNLQDRGVFFVGPAVNIYRGQILGEHCREGDLVVNAAKGKKLTNMRASGSDDNVQLTPPKKMSLENCLTFIEEDELVEVTPKAIRLRKIILDETERKRASRSK